MSRCLKPCGGGHDSGPRTLIGVMVLAACSVPGCALTGEDASDRPAGQVSDDGIEQWSLPDRRDDLYFREGWSAGQAIQTPDDLSRKDPIEDDVPYAAARIGA